MCIIKRRPFFQQLGLRKALFVRTVGAGVTYRPTRNPVLYKPMVNESYERCYKLPYWSKLIHSRV